MIFELHKAKRICAVDKITGSKYEIGTTKILFPDNTVDTQFSFYIFELRDLQVNWVFGYKFSVYRHGMGVVATQDTHYLEFEIED